MKKSGKKTARQLIYIGPTLSRARLIKYQVYIGGYPIQAEEVAETFPQIKKLFVPVAELTQAERETKTKGTPLYKYYQQAKEV